MNSNGGLSVISGTASEAILSIIASARTLKGFAGVKVDDMDVFVSETTHFSTQRGAAILGINTVMVNTTMNGEGQEHSMDTNDLKKKIKQSVANKRVPICVVLT